ncbi:MAG: ABC transporter ATP-binding protein [Actinomycetota bacterium]
MARTPRRPDDPASPPTGRLRSPELAEAVVLADLAVLGLLVARLTPFSALAPAVAAIPVAVLASRRRIRAVAVAGWVMVVLSFLLASFGTAQSALVGLLWGAVAGRAHRHGWGTVRLLSTTIAIGWTTVVAATLAVLSVFVEFRRLALEQVEIQWGGLSEILRSAGLDPVADLGDDAVSTAIRWWWISVPAFQLLVSIGLALIVRRFSRPVLRRVDRSLGPPEPVVDPVASLGDDAPGIELAGVGVRRGPTAVLQEVDLRLEPGTVTVLVGPNGAGKSTLLQLLAGQRLAEVGVVERTGIAALGRPGGTAVVSQRPESQVIGARVGDDLAWGLDDAPSADEIERALRAVGLTGWADRSTTGLSGGELQRVALAAAIVRRPAVLLSDESTAMVDPDGREAIRDALRAAADAGAIVVHATHLPDDRRIADRVVVVDGGRVVDAQLGGAS